nr:hypothetical protein [Microbacterium hydrocarbonoxydans]
MRLRSLAVLGTVALLLMSGCSAEPAPDPTPPAPSSASATPAPTPTTQPIAAPEAAFDVTCDDVAAEMSALFGEPSAPVQPVLSVVSTMGWIPGPAQHMFQQVGGIACSADSEVDRRWEVTIVPDAQAVIEGATERQGYWGEQAGCSDGSCTFEFPDGDVLLSATVFEPGVTAAETGAVEAAMRRLAADAAATVRQVGRIDSDLIGAPCERFITEQQVNEQFGVSDAVIYSDFGGWGIPAEIYHVANGSRICMYRTAASEYEGPTYLLLTSLPGGAWAFEQQAGISATVEGADAAKTSTGEHGENFLDVRVGADWFRIVTYDDGSGAPDPTPSAESVVRNLTVGQPAPQ